MSSDMPFFATAGDIGPVVQEVEASNPIDYIRMGHYVDTPISRISICQSCPGFGFANADDAIKCTAYLVVKHRSKILLRTIKYIDGRVASAVDQLENPDSIVVSWGGLWGRDTLIAGRIATVSKTPDARDLMRAFGSRIRKTFNKRGVFWVGNEADKMLLAGKRLTESAQSPSSFDLKP